MNHQKESIIDLTREDDDYAAHNSNDHLQKLQAALQDSAKGATFSCGGTLPIKQQVDGKMTPRTAVQVSEQVTLIKPVTIRWGAHGSGQVLTLPSSTDTNPALRSLLTTCEPAAFGRNGRNILDESYRRATKLDTTEFVTDFSPYEAGIIDIIAQLLLPSLDTTHCGIRAELYKLNAYSGPYGHFKAHVDTPRSVDQIGSLVVCLPIAFEGGALAVRHDGVEIVYDWSKGEHVTTSIQWAAFYSDCEHEVLPVTSGHRVTLTYNLYTARGAGVLSGGQNLGLDRTKLPLYQILHEVLASSSFMSAGGTLGIYLQHYYPFANEVLHKNIPITLKGSDMAVYGTLAATNLDFSLVRYFEPNFDADEEDEEEISRCGDDYSDSNGSQFVPEPHDHFCAKGFAPAVVIDEYEEESKRETFERIVVNAGACGYDNTEITWLMTRPGSRELTHTFLTYGNEATIDTIYASAAFLIQIPSVHRRSGQVDRNPSKKHKMTHSAQEDVATFVDQDGNLKKAASFISPPFVPAQLDPGDYDTDPDDGFTATLKREFDRLDGVDITMEFIEAGCMSDQPLSEEKFSQVKRSL